MTQQNYFYHDNHSGRPIKAWTRGVPVEDQAMDQLRNIAGLNFIHKHVAAMPDIHFGRGATVGSIIPTRNAIVPAAVGVDLGCGMIASRTSLTANDLPDNLHNLRCAIEAAVPHGGPGAKGTWVQNGGEVPESVAFRWKAHFGRSYSELADKHPGVVSKFTAEQLGTLGGGNHFLEVCLDESDRVWVMLHSGSRGLGNRIGSYFIEQARSLMDDMLIELPDKDLAYLPRAHPLFDDYWAGLQLAQEYARINRNIMLGNMVTALREHLPGFEVTDEIINCHHNYAELENHFGENVYVTRKGAVRARQGDRGIIPGSMGTQSHIVTGKGNADSFHSCSHGAGRVMSRSAAKRQITPQAHAEAMQGIEARLDADVLDESPAAYKDVSAVMGAQADLVRIDHTLRQVVNVKG